VVFWVSQPQSRPSEDADPEARLPPQTRMPADLMIRYLNQCGFFVTKYSRLFSWATVGMTNSR